MSRLTFDTGRKIHLGREHHSTDRSALPRSRKSDAKLQNRVKSEATLPQSTDKRIASILLIAAVGLFASLLPPTTFVGHRSGPPIDALPAVWPGAGVQQDLGDVSEPVTDVAIWVRTTNAFGAVVRVDASIVTGPQSLPLTQFSFEASGTALNRRILLFESYDHPPDGDVRLQLVVPEGLTIAAVFGSADQSAGLDRAIHNGDPVMNRGPLAFESISAGPGLKAAFLGVESERSRLGLAAILLLIATTLHPSSLLLIRRFAGIAMMFIRPAFDVTTRWISFGLHSPARRSTDRPAASTPPVATRSWLFYPWIIAIYPVLHFTVSNAITFRLVDAALVYGLSLGATTIGLLTARMLIGDFARATLVILAIQAAFFRIRARCGPSRRTGPFIRRFSRCSRSSPPGLYSNQSPCPSTVRGLLDVSSTTLRLCLLRYRSSHSSDFSWQVCRRSLHHWTNAQQSVPQS